MKVLVTGATGFTGSYVVAALVEMGLEVRCFVREKSDITPIASHRIEISRGDLADRASLNKAMLGVDALVNVASLGFGHAPVIVDAALSAGVARAIFFSTTAVFTSIRTSSKVCRLAAEEKIKASGLRYTIFRPTMIYGAAKDRNMCRLIRYLKRYPVIPIIGTGTNLQQPVYVQDLADAVVGAICSDRTCNEGYNLPGAAAISFNEVVDIICRLLKRHVRKIYLPQRPFVAGLSLIERVSSSLPIKSEQIRRLNEDKAFDYSRASAHFGYSPRSFSEGIQAEIADMRLI